MKPSPWRWIPSLFATEEIPAAIVTYVAVLMFLQTDNTPTMATCYCGLLFLPWVLKSFMRSYVRRLGYFRRQLQWLELCIVAALMALSFSFIHLHPQFSTLNYQFSILFLLSFLTAWHELAARMYYERMLRPWQQRYYNTPKIVTSQSAVVLTYGVFIMLVGALQVIYRRIPRSWHEGCYLVAGMFLILALYHLFTLRRPSVNDSRQPGTAIGSIQAEIRVIDRIRHRPQWFVVVMGLFLLLLPQSLMFYSRVLFLYLPKAEGGLGCTIQEIGFAQGTIGVIAFSLGMLLARTSGMGGGRGICFLGLSPIVYLVMSYFPPTSLGWLCVGTFTAQFLFGYGLNAIMPFVHYISGERYRNTINYLYIPLVATAMLPFMAISGWLVTIWGFRLFFLIDVLTAPVAWLYLYINRKTILNS